MNEKDFNFLKQNYLNERKENNFGLRSLIETINEVFETGDDNLLLEQEGGSLTLRAIPDISVTELGWTDVRTEGNQQVDGPARNQLMQYSRYRS